MAVDMRFKGQCKRCGTLIGWEEVCLVVRCPTCDAAYEIAEGYYDKLLGDDNDGKEKYN